MELKSRSGAELHSPAARLILIGVLVLVNIGAALLLLLPAWSDLGGIRSVFRERQTALETVQQQFTFDKVDARELEALLRQTPIDSKDSAALRLFDRLADGAAVNLIGISRKKGNEEPAADGEDNKKTKPEAIELNVTVAGELAPLLQYIGSLQKAERLIDTIGWSIKELKPGDVSKYPDLAQLVEGRQAHLMEIELKLYALPRLAKAFGDQAK